MSWAGLIAALVLVLAVTAFLTVELLMGSLGNTQKVQHRERALGVHPALQALLDAWEARGPHSVVVAPYGGLRTDEALQAGFAAAGNSNATTLRSTPHGRGAALDVYPSSFLPLLALPWAAVPDDVRAQFEAFGIFAEERGFTWGGRWRGPKFPNGDQGHVEVKSWTDLPFPPPDYVAGEA